jgi:hypothetical protein
MLSQREKEMTSDLNLREDDLHSKRITFDTAEWYRRLEELAKLRQLETSNVSRADDMTPMCKLAVLTSLSIPSGEALECESVSATWGGAENAIAAVGISGMQLQKRRVPPPIRAVNKFLGL